MGPKTRAEMIASLGRIYVAKRDVFDESDVRTILGILDMCARAPNAGVADGGIGGGGGAGFGQSGGPPGGSRHAAVAPVQRACVDFILQLAPLDDKAVRAGVFPLLLRQLLAYITEAVGGVSVMAHSRERLAILASMSEVDAADDRDQCQTQPGAMSFAFADLACNAFTTVYQTHAPARDRAEVFGPAVKVLSAGFTLNPKP